MKNYQYLNLEQKMAKIRKKMPVLVKKFHSEDVAYDFSKLDDIYELMTPALNKYGVNFDPVAERPTQVNEAGSPTYLTLDKDGYWRYEADLDVCWTNADRPEEQKPVTIHAVGTHEIPDKAKGAAWTYAMKTYLRNKFSVPQGSDEDPDMATHGLSEVSEDGQTQPEETGEKDSRSSQKHAAGKAVKETAKQEPAAGKASGKEMPDRTRQEKKEPKGTAPDPKKAQDLNEKKTDAPPEEKADEKPKDKPKASAKQEEAVKAQPEGAEPAPGEDGFHTVSKEEEIPFDELDEDGSLMDALNEELGMDGEDAGDDAYLQARNVKCTFGIFNGKTLGEMMDSGTKGRETLRWITNSYKGSDLQMVEAARTLLAGEHGSLDAMAA